MLVLIPYMNRPVSRPNVRPAVSGVKVLENEIHAQYRDRYPQGKDEYFALFSDAGWEHAGDYFNWHYFRSPAEANALEVFADVESRVAKYRSLLLLVGLMAIVNLSLIPGMIDRAFFERASNFGRVAVAGQSCLVLLLAYCVFRLWMHIWRIRHPRAAK